jgi:hypothetical protein
VFFAQQVAKESSRGGQSPLNTFCRQAASIAQRRKRSNVLTVELAPLFNIVGGAEFE